LLEQLGIRFETANPGEVEDDLGRPKEQVIENALAKARKVVKLRKTGLVVAADTVVAVGDARAYQPNITAPTTSTTPATTSTAPATAKTVSAAASTAPDHLKLDKEPVPREGTLQTYQGAPGALAGQPGQGGHPGHVGGLMGRG